MRRFLLALALCGALTAAEQDLYELLGVPPDASDREVKRAYHRRAGLLHPDKCAGDACATADEKMAVLNDAYEILSSPERRERYDAYGTAEPDLASLYAVSPSVAYADSHVTNLQSVGASNALSPDEGLWLVAFYMQGCGPCHKLVPELKAAASRLAGVARVAAVDCANNDAPCVAHAIHKYPQLVAFAYRPLLRRKAPVHYEGGHNPKAIVEWALSLLPQKAAAIDTRGLLGSGSVSRALVAVILTSGIPRLILFSDGPNRVEQDEAAIASALLAGSSLRLGQIDCHADSMVDAVHSETDSAGGFGGLGGACAKLKVKFAPSAWFFDGVAGSVPQEYDGKMLGSRMAMWAADLAANQGAKPLGSIEEIAAAATDALRSSLLLLGTRSDASAHKAALKLEVLRLRATFANSNLTDAAGSSGGSGVSEGRWADPLCSDQSADCEGWAEKGECKSNAMYMATSCQRACSLCATVPAPALFLVSCDNLTAAGNARRKSTDVLLSPLGWSEALWGALCGSIESGAPPGAVLGIPPPTERDFGWKGSGGKWWWLGGGGGGDGEWDAAMGKAGRRDQPENGNEEREKDRVRSRLAARAVSARLGSQALLQWAGQAERAALASNAGQGPALHFASSGHELTAALTADAGTADTGGANSQALSIVLLTGGAACALCADAESAFLQAAATGVNKSTFLLAQCDASASLANACTAALSAAHTAQLPQLLVSWTSDGRVMRRPAPLDAVALVKFAQIAAVSSLSTMEPSSLRALLAGDAFENVFRNEYLFRNSFGEASGAFVLFTAGAWCAPCKMAEEPFFLASSVLKANGIVAASVLCDKDLEHKELCTSAGIKGMPTLVYFPHVSQGTVVLSGLSRGHMFDEADISADVLLAFSQGGWSPSVLVPLGAKGLWQSLVRPSTRTAACRDWSPVSCRLRGRVTCGDETHIGADPAMLAECASTCGVCKAERATTWVILLSTRERWCGLCPRYFKLLGSVAQIARAALVQVGEDPDSIQFGEIDCTDESTPEGQAACMQVGIRSLPHVRIIPADKSSDSVLRDHGLYALPSPDPGSSEKHLDAHALASWALAKHRLLQKQPEPYNPGTGHSPGTGERNVAGSFAASTLADPSSLGELGRVRAAGLRVLAEKHGVDCSRCVEKEDWVAQIAAKLGLAAAPEPAMNPFHDEL
mmetsp:Transcript_15610/g.39705  ORF Transcript_15610/g.39705 Transcript_15610/m.39705 type:complete len:1177 (-) Transcript_15610:81-3611(-)